MQFTVMPAAGVGLLIGQGRGPESPLAPLGKVRRAQGGEVTGAATRDGEWIFEMNEDGTWAAGHLPTETEVKRGLRSLEACRAYEASGQALADLKRLQSERKETSDA